MQQNQAPPSPRACLEFALSVSRVRMHRACLGSSTLNPPGGLNNRLVIHKISFITTRLVSRRWLRASCRGVLHLVTSLTVLVSPLFSSPPLTSPPPTILPRYSPYPPSPRACPGLASGVPRACLQQGVASGVFRVFWGQVWLARLQGLEHASSTPRGRSTPLVYHVRSFRRAQVD